MYNQRDEKNMEENQYSTAMPLPLTHPTPLCAFGPEPNQLGQRASLSHPPLTAASAASGGVGGGLNSPRGGRRRQKE